MSGQMVGESVWNAAKAEVDEAEARLASVDIDGLVMIQHPDETQNDKAVHMLGEIFLVLETFMLEMHRKGGFQLVDGRVADILIRARKLLKQAGYEPVKHRRREPITFMPKK
jgi:hypothetical protein